MPEHTRRRFLKFGIFSTISGLAGCTGFTPYSGNQTNETSTGTPENPFQLTPWPYPHRTAAKTNATPDAVPEDKLQAQWSVGVPDRANSTVLTAPLVTSDSICGLTRDAIVAGSPRSGDQSFVADYSTANSALVNDGVVITRPKEDTRILGLQLSDGSREFLSRLPGATEQDYNDLRFYPADDRLFYSVNYETDSLNGRGTEFGALSLPDLSQLWQNRAVDQSGEIEVCGGVKDPDASYVFVTRINTTVTERVEEGREPAVEAYDLESGRQQWHVDIHGLPLAAHNGRLYVGLPRYDFVTSRGLNGIAALEIDTGEEIWRRDDPSLIMNTIATGNSMAVDDSGVYLALEHSLMSLDPTDGSTQWQYQTTEPIVTTPVAAGNAVVVGSQPRLHTVSKSDGSQLSISRIQGEAAGRGITGSIAVAGRAVFAGTDRGIVAFA